MPETSYHIEYRILLLTVMGSAKAPDMNVVGCSL